MSSHLPVMLQETLEHFSDLSMKVFFDGTLGAGGHAHAILEAHPEIEMYLGCDRDLSAIELAQVRLVPWKKKMIYVHDNFRNMDRHFEKYGIKEVNGFFLT